MANYYTRFSEVIDLNEEEYKWFEEQLEWTYLYNGEVRRPDEAFSADFLQDNAEWQGYRFFSFLSPNEMPNFEAELVNENGERYVWIYADEYAEPEYAAMLVQAFLKRFRPNDCWTMTYACTCSKPRPGAFGGGVVFVTADTIDGRNTAELAEEFRTKASRRNPQPA